jgi:hypothetical protein
MNPVMNRNVWTLSVISAATVSLLGCSTPVGVESGSGETQRDVAAQAPDIARVDNAVTTACRLATLGLPCDPDGAGEATECEGLCWADDQAEVSCRPVAELNMAVVDLNGRICGDGPGNNCARSCENGVCVDKNARLGTACRPNTNSNACEGACTLEGGEPKCDTVAVCASVGISDDGCELRACNFDSFELGCITYELENPVCEASKIPPVVVVDAGGSSTTSDDVRDGGSVTGGDAGQSTGDAAVTSTNDTQSRSDSNSNSSNSDSTSDSSRSRSDESVGDAGDAGDTDDTGRRPRVANRAVKVVGGACAVSSAPGSNDDVSRGLLASLALLGLAVFRRRS